VIINHSSHLDFPVLAKHFPLKLKVKLAMGAAADYFFKNENLKDKLISKLFYYLFAAFPLSRQKDNESGSSIKQSFEFIGEILSKGWSIGLSPEGTRSKDGKLGRFRTGIGLIVKETGLPVIPVKLEGLHDILPPHSKFPKKIGTVTIKFGKPVYFSHDKGAVEITNELEDIMRRM
jgi:1-acyl-sn-glycerol-3-phosphate acyltransferase